MNVTGEGLGLVVLIAVVVVSGMAGVYAPSHPAVSEYDSYFFGVALLSLLILGLWKPLVATWLSAAGLPAAWGLYVLNGYREPAGVALQLASGQDQVLAVLAGAVVALSGLQLVLLACGRQSLFGDKG